MALIGHWLLDEGTGTTAADDTASSNDGTLTNMTNDDWVTGPNNLPALDFDGSNDHVTMGDVTTFDGLSQISLAAHINSANTGIFRTVISKDQSGNRGFYLAHNSDSVQALYSHNGTDLTSWRSDGTLLSDNTDYHIAATLDLSTGTGILYIDGSAVAATKTGSGTGTLNNNTASLMLGSSTGASTNFFEGEISDPRIYDNILSSGDVATLAALSGATALVIADVSHAHTVDPLTLGPQETLVIAEISHAHAVDQLDLIVPAELIGHWLLNEGSGTTAADSGAGGNDGTLTNMAADDWVTGPNYLPALEFDGTDDRVDMGDVTDFDGLSQISLAAHINIPDTGGFGVVLGKNSNTGDQRGFYLGYILDSVIALYSTNGINSTYWRSDGTLLSDGTDHHIAATMDLSTGIGILYIDGSAVSASKTGSDTGTIPNTTARLLIGAQADGVGAEDFTAGQIADPRIYDGILTAGEVATLAALAGATPLSIADIVHAHTMDNQVLYVGVITVQNIVHAHLVDSPSLVTQETLIPSEISHAHTVESLTLGTLETLAIDDLLHAHNLDQIILVPGAIPELVLGTVVNYTCTISAPTFSDLVVPISSFQMTLRQSPLQCYLNVVIPKILDYAEDISDRASGEVSVAQVVDGVSTTLLTANLSTIRTDQGATNRSGTLTSYKQITFPATSSVTLFGASYKSTTNGTRRYRCLPHPDIKPMDNANINGETFTVENIQWQVTAGTPHTMEILEYTP